MKGIINKTTRLNIKAKRPVNLVGKNLKIAYANKKYHSGTICLGVIIAFALLKFSGSPNIYGLKNTKYPKIIRYAQIPTKSFQK